MRTGGFLRTFCICALFAALYVIVDGVREGMRMRDAVVGGVAIGLFTGLFMAAWLGMMRHTLEELGGGVSRLRKRARRVPELPMTAASPPAEAEAPHRVGERAETGLRR